MAPRLCDYHSRAGVAVPAVRFVAGTPMCAACFDGKPVFSQQERETRKVLRPAQVRRTAPKTDRALRRAERIRAINPTADRFAPLRPVPSPAPARKIRIITSSRSEKTRSLPAPPPHGDRPRHGARLSPREVEILRLLTESLGTKEIATTLGISARTVKYHIGNALAKSGKRDRWSLMTWFAQNRAPAMPSKEEIDLRSLVRDSVARIEAELAAVTCAIRDRVAGMEREIEGCTSPRTK